MKGKYDKILSALQFRNIGNDTFVLAKYFIDHLKLIHYIDDNKVLLNEEQWRGFYKQYQDNETIEMKLIETPEIPAKVIDDIIDFNKENLLNSQIVAICNRADVSEEQIQKILKYCSEQIVAVLYNRYSQNRKEVINLLVPDDIIIKFGEQILRDYGTEECISILSITSNMPFILKVLNECPDGREKERLVEAVCNNIRLSEDFRNQVFEMGCDSLKIYNPTPYMSNKIYSSFSEIIDNYIVDGYFMFGQEDTISTLKTWAYENKLTEAIEHDYIDRFLHYKATRKNELLEEILSNTKNESTLILATKLNSKNSIWAYNNPNMPSQYLIKKANDYLRTIRKALEKDTVYPAFWKNYLQRIIKKVQLPIQDYETIVKLNDDKLNEVMIYSPHTPINVLKQLKVQNEKMIENHKNSPKLFKYEKYKRYEYIINVNIKLQTTSLSQETKEKVIEFLKDIENVLQTTQKPSLYEKRRIQKFKDNMSECYDDVFLLLNSSLQETKSDILKRIMYLYNFFQEDYQSIDKTILILAEEKEKIIETISKERDKVKQHILIEQNVDRFNEIQEQLDKAIETKVEER